MVSAQIKLLVCVNLYLLNGTKKRDSLSGFKNREWNLFGMRGHYIALPPLIVVKFLEILL